MFDPRLLFLIIWGSQVAGFLLNDYQFYPLAAQTWQIFAVGTFGFYAGSSLALSSFGNARALEVPVFQGSDRETDLVRRFFLVAQICYAVACALAIKQITSVLGADALISGDMAQLRLAFVNDFVGERELFTSVRVFYFGVGLCIFQLAHAIKFSASERAIVLGIGLISAIATTGRLYLLLYMLACAYLLYRQKLASKRTVAMLFLGFVLIFFAVALLFEKGSGEGSVFEQLLWNLRIYLLSSLACFNDYVTTGAQETPGGLLIPNALRALLKIIGISMPEKPDLLPFAMVPQQCNTYTVLFPLYHDGNLIGVLIGLTLIGLFSTFFWLKQRTTPTPNILFTYAVLLYPLAMSMFEDAYFSSPGFWALLWTPPTILSMLLARHRATMQLR